MLLLLAFVAVISTVSADKQTYIVRMDKTKITNTYNSLANSKPWHETVLDSIAEVSAEQGLEATRPELIYSYQTAFFGFAAKLSAKQLESLKKVDGFVSAIPDKMLSLHTTHTPQFLGLEGMKGLWQSSDLQSDVIIGVVDTGIWPEHVSFQDQGMPPVPARWKGTCEKGTGFSPSNCNKKLIGARAFYGGYLAAGGRINEKEEYLSARDTSGHGTHTASTAAGDYVEQASLFGLANGSAAGMRYTARIAMYKVCWPRCTTLDIITAIVQAIDDGVDVLSISLGSRSEAEPYYEDPVAIASFYAFASGIFLTFSAGNNGPEEYTAVNTAPWIMTVAASTIDRSFPTIVKLGNGHTFEGSSLYTGSDTKQFPIVYGKTAGGRGAEYCLAGSLNPVLVKGKFVICEQRFVSTTAKGEQVKLAGGVGMIIVSTEGEDLASEVHILPATLLGALASQAIKEYVSSTEVPTASIAFNGTTYGNRAPMVAAFSSRGPNLVGPDVIKPDVTAPGVDILAAWPAGTSPSSLKNDQRRVLFNIISGTSMACPHVSGIAALLKSKHKNWSPAAIKSALMTTAYTIDNRGKPIADLAFYGSATPFAFGSGHIDPVKASNPGLIYDISAEDYIYYLCSLKYNASQISLFADGFTCPKKETMQPGDLNYPSFAVNFKAKAQNITVTYKRTVTNVGIPRSSYKVSVEGPKGVSVIVKPNILSFNKLGEKLSYKVSFIGRSTVASSSSFGSLVWVSGNYRVRSPIAVTWN
ncbi:subtilisin-like protease SBT1.1 isoform X3 [Durio zibethinus]|nr:subtilisin-like protease SBT1.1 isoform X3 [Durio zibethinus]XP_022757158.1 subtilisin-like protease SBT1.1 isoform X3 [Durio zibethinus]